MDIKEVSSGAVVRLGDTLNVLNGGKIVDASIFHSGLITLSSGATASRTDVGINGSMRVCANATASDTVVSYGGILDVEGRSTDISVTRGGHVQFSEGSIIEGTVDLNGSATFNGNVDASRATFNLNIFDIGWSEGVIVNSIAACQQGTLNIKVNSVAQNRGSYAIANGAGQLSKGITLSVGNENKGTLYSSGNTIQVSNAIYSLSVSGDTLYLNVDYTHASHDVRLNVLSNGTFQVASSGSSISNINVIANQVLDADRGGLISNADVNGGALRVFDGALARNIVLNNGQVIVSGAFIETTSVVNGYMTVANSGVIRDTIMTGGALIAANGGRAYDTIVKHGVVALSSGGYLSKTTFSGGSINVSMGGSAFDTIVSSGAVIYVENGGTVAKTTLNAGATIAIFDGGYCDNMTVKTGADVDISAGANVTDMLIEGQMVELEIGITTNTNVTYTSDGKKYEIKKGLMDGVIVNANTYLQVSSGGVVRNLHTTGYVEPQGSGAGGAMQLFGGAKAYDAANYASGQINVFSGAYLSGAYTENDAEIYLYGGSANNITMGSSGYLWVHSGSFVNEVYVNRNGGFTVSSGGRAENVIISGGHTIVEQSNAHISNVIVRNGGTLEICGANASGVVISSGGIMTFSEQFWPMGGPAFISSPNGKASDITISSGGVLAVRQTASASKITLMNGGDLQVWAGAGITGLVTNGGYAGIFSGASACNTEASAGATLEVYRGAVHSGYLYVTSGANVYVNGTLDFTVSGRTARSGYLVNDLSLVKGTSTYTISVSDNQETGTYKLAQGANNFSGSVTIGNGKVNFGSISVNGDDLFYNGVNYSLDQVGGNLTLTIAAAPVLSGNAAGVSWENIAGESFVVEYSNNGFANSLQIETQTNALDTFNMPSGTYQWHVKAEDGEFVNGETIVSDNNSAPQEFVSDADGNTDLFFGKSAGTWNKGFGARHLGYSGWNGTRERVLLSGKNKISDIFEGSSDANILVLTDDANGDALFVDDIYSALGEQSRIAQIDEIRAGAGDDVVDMTSQRYAYSGSGVKVYGGLGNDTIWANKGSNTIFGDAGNDRLVGASGNDVIVGGSGNDSMHGGGGDDIFTFGGAWGCDTVEQLANGSVTLWFETGSESNWDAESLTYSDGVNSVSVSGSVNVTLRFGAEASLPAGCFETETSKKIFEDKGILA